MISFRSKLYFGGVSLFVCTAVFLGILLYRANQLQEPIIIYKTVIPEGHAASRPSEKPAVRTSNAGDETEVVFTPADSNMSTDPIDFAWTDTQFLDTDVQSEESIASDPTEEQSFSEPEKERFFGLTLDEIQEEIPVLEREISTNLARAVELYTSLRSTDELANASPEVAAWRNETWTEVKRLFYEASRQKIPRYVSYLGVIGGDNPLLRGGWLSEMMKPLPMGVTYGGMSE